jgi:hypothetical protein
MIDWFVVTLRAEDNPAFTMEHGFETMMLRVDGVRRVMAGRRGTCVWYDQCVEPMIVAGSYDMVCRRLKVPQT